MAVHDRHRYIHKDDAVKYVSTGLAYIFRQLTPNN